MQQEDKEEEELGHHGSEFEWLALGQVSHHTTESKKPHQLEHSQQLVNLVGLSILVACVNERRDQQVEVQTGHEVNPESTLDIVACNLFGILNEFIRSWVHIATPEIDQDVKDEESINDEITNDVPLLVFECQWEGKFKRDLDRVVDGEDNDKDIPLDLELVFWLKDETFPALA